MKMKQALGDQSLRRALLGSAASQVCEGGDREDLERFVGGTVK